MQNILCVDCVEDEESAPIRKCVDCGQSGCVHVFTLAYRGPVCKNRAGCNERYAETAQFIARDHHNRGGTW